ncbi:MAG TPA: hypothetical protein VEY51_07640 [Chondromyces sp.]|nr:hypothetical protein [Chondromyces sp.]
MKTYNQEKKDELSLKGVGLPGPSVRLSAKTQKPIWPWIVIGFGAVSLIGAGPGAIMLPIMPLFLAAMSTDSGNTPDYVPSLILVIGYGLLIGYTTLLIKAIKTLRSK